MVVLERRCEQGYVDQGVLRQTWRLRSVQPSPRVKVQMYVSQVTQCARTMLLCLAHAWRTWFVQSSPSWDEDGQDSQWVVRRWSSAP